MGSSASKPPKITPKDKAILDLKVQRDKLKKYQTQLESVRERETQVAQECLRRGDKKRALLALKKKKYQDSLLEKTDNQLMKLEELTSTIEFAVVEQEFVKGLKTGSEVLVQLNKEMNIADVEKLMDDTREAVEYQNEIDGLLTSNLSPTDLDAIEKELDSLIVKEINAKLPSVPETKLPESVEKKKEQEKKTEPKPTRIKSATEERRASLKEAMEEEMIA